MEHCEENELTVILVNYRTPDLTIEAAKSILPQLIGASSLVIVDNASGDESLDKLQSFARGWDDPHKTVVVASATNSGFSAGNNQGFKARPAKWFLLMNSDAIARPGAVAAMTEIATLNAGCGAVTPSLVDHQGILQTSRFRSHSPITELVDGAETGPVTKFFSNGDVAISTDDWETAPDWVSFAAVLISNEVIQKIGPMDESFFLYYEDCDFCRRVLSAGYKIMAAPDAVFAHEAGGTTGVQGKIDDGARLPEYYYVSRNRYYRKYYGPLGPVWANLFWYLGRMIAHLRGVAGRPAPQTPHGRWRDIWINWRGTAANKR